MGGGAFLHAALTTILLICDGGVNADQFKHGRGTPIKNPTHYGPPLPLPLPKGHGPPVSCKHDEDPQFISSFVFNVTSGKTTSVLRQWCAPRLVNGTDCPTDVPPGATTSGAKPKAFVSDPGKMNCYLSCTRNSDCGGGAVCETKSLGTGGCTWIVNGSTSSDYYTRGDTAMPTDTMALNNDFPVCVGSSAMLAPTECAAMQELFAGWNMSQYPGCDVRDPCNCSPRCRMGACAIYCDTDADGTGFVQGISLTAVNPPLKGTISEAIGNLTKLDIIFLDVNELTGTIPVAFANMKNLASINLIANRLSGTIPVGQQSKPWAGTTELLSLGCNALTGVVPAMDFKNGTGKKQCDLNDDAAWCTEYFGPRPSNKFSCPLPDGAAQYCNAKCDPSI